MIINTKRSDLGKKKHEIDAETCKTSQKKSNEISKLVLKFLTIDKTQGEE